jgi:hypothetical protein
MNLFLAFFLSLFPLGTFVYDLQQQPLDREFKLKWNARYHEYILGDSTDLPIPKLKKTASYITTKQAIRSKQKSLQAAYKAAKSTTEKNEIRKNTGIYITEQLVNGLFPHWYGTTWSFDGYSAIPNQGEIGCSYFVSTTLLHVGFNLNRYRLAQQGPVSEARSLTIEGSPIQIDLTEDFEDFVPEIEKHCEAGLYFIGLGHSHVGYLYYREQECYFIQSSYGESVQVEIDYANDSDILMGFSNFVLVPITTNAVLLEAWLLGEEVVVVKGSE